jgi:hypothetical protein
MSRSLMFGAALAVASCGQSATDKAKARYEFLKEQNATKGEVCDAAKAWRDAWVERGDPKGYKEADMYASIDCIGADLEGRSMPYRDVADVAAEAKADELEAVAGGAADERSVEVNAAAAEAAAGEALREADAAIGDTVSTEERGEDLPNAAEAGE